MEKKQKKKKNEMKTFSKWFTGKKHYHNIVLNTHVNVLLTRFNTYNLLQTVKVNI